MSTMIENIKIEGLFGSTNIDWNLQETNILVGKNGTGKSTILQIIQDLILENEDSTKLKLCTSISMKIKSMGIKKLEQEELLNVLQKFKPKDSILSLINNDKDIPDELKRKIIKELEEISFIEKPSKDINIEFISTVNMSANSIQDIKTSDGQVANILDFEIEKQIIRLINLDKKSKNKAKANFLKSINIMFEENCKTVQFDKNNNLNILYQDKILQLNQLSSGERQLIYIFLKAIIANHTGALLLMDEPEISLHLSWQKKLLTEIRKINDVSQIIVVTHSPAIVVGKWFDSFIDIKDITTEMNRDAGVGRNS